MGGVVHLDTQRGIDRLFALEQVVQDVCQLGAKMIQVVIQIPEIFLAKEQDFLILSSSTTPRPTGSRGATS